MSRCFNPQLVREFEMMALPFATLFVGLICAWRGYRFWAIGLWAAAFVLTITLFLLHATDPLGVQF